MTGRMSDERLAEWGLRPRGGGADKRLAGPIRLGREE